MWKDFFVTVQYEGTKGRAKKLFKKSVGRHKEHVFNVRVVNRWIELGEDSVS